MKAFNGASAIFFLLIGVLIPTAWSVILGSGEAPELGSTPVSTAFHFVAETILAVSCIAAGAGLLKGSPWARRLLSGACGLLIAAAINAGSFCLFDPLYQNGSMAAFLALLVILTLAVFIPQYRQSIRETGGAGGMFLLTCGMLVYLLINTAGFFGQKCLDDSGVYSGAFFLLILGTLLLARFLGYAVFRGTPYCVSRD